MKTTIIKTDESITIEVEGRIDTTTAPTLNQEIEKSMEMLDTQPTYKKLIIDFNNVEYISSAGLRTMLVAHKTTQKKEKEFILINVNSEVFEIFKMSGFNKFLKIQER